MKKQLEVLRGRGIREAEAEDATGRLSRTSEESLSRAKMMKKDSGRTSGGREERRGRSQEPLAARF